MKTITTQKAGSKPAAGRPVLGGQAIKLLLIEHDPRAARQVEKMLAEAGTGETYQVTHAGILAGALEVLPRVDPHVILLNLNLPNERSPQAIERLKAAAARHPLILLSGPEDDQAAARTLQEAASDDLPRAGLEAALLTRAIRYVLERQQAEAELAASQGVFKAAFESAISGMGLVSESGTLVSANNELCRLLGYQRRELENRPFKDILHPLDERFISAMFERALSGESSSLSFESRFLRKDGEVIWAQISGSLVRSGAGLPRLFTLHIHDITEPLYAATRLRQTEEKYHSLFENIPDGVYRTSPDGTFLAANPALVRMLGFGSEDRLRQVRVQDLHADPAAREEFIRLAEGHGEIRDYEMRLLRQDGSTIYVLNNARAFRDKDGSLQYIEGTLTDITARKQAQEAQRESETRYRTLTEQVPGVIYRTLYEAPNTDVYISPQIEALLGFTPQEWLASPNFWLEHVHPDDREYLLKLDSDVQAGRPEINSEYRMLSRQGRVVWVEDHSRLLRDETGKPLYYQGLLTDITARKQAETTLRLLEEKFSKAFQSSPDAICILRLNDGIFLDVNRGFTELFGHSAAEVLGKSPGAIGLWADLAERKNLMQALNAQSDVDQIEIALRVKDGGLRNCQVSSRHIEINNEACVLLIMRDMTASLRAAEALTESNRRLSDTLENIHLAAVILDPAGRLTFCNDYLLKLTGWVREEVMGADWFELFSTGSGAREEFAANMRMGIIPAHLENTIRTREDGKLRISWNNTALRDPDGRLNGMASIGEDITRRAWAEAALRESEERYRNIYENATIGMYRTTPAGEILMSNPALLRMLGFDSFDELAAHNLEREPGMVNFQRTDFQRKIESAGQVKGLEGAWRRRDGSTIYVRESARVIREPDGKVKFYEGTIEDITDRKVAEEALQRQLERLNALRTIDETIIGSPDLKFILNVLLEQIGAQLKVDACLIMLYSEETRLLRFGASKGFRTDNLRQATQQVGRTFAGRVARERASLYIPEISKDTGSAFMSGALAGEDFVTYLGIPLIAKGQVKGILEIFMRSFFSPNDEWTGLLEMMSGLAAISIENATLFEGLQRSNFDLETAYDTTLEGWSRALDLRDRETEGHSRRVSGLTVSMAQAIGFSDREIVQLRRGALLHDIGKMGIPDSILLKDGTLTQAEWKTMRKHPTYAYELLAPIKYLQPALDIPYCHHERWDGSGYPRGLKGTQIPLAARIFAVVDVYDALTSNRPYRPAWENQRAYKYLRDQAGKLFDPLMVELFFKVVGA